RARTYGIVGSGTGNAGPYATQRRQPTRGTRFLALLTGRPALFVRQSLCSFSVVGGSQQNAALDSNRHDLFDARLENQMFQQDRNRAGDRDGEQRAGYAVKREAR